MTRNSAADLEIWRNPPVYRLLSSGMRLEGNHVNKVWRGLAHPQGGSESGVPMIVKWLPKAVPLATELACALAGQALRLQVPRGALVLADADQLPGLPRRFEGRTVLCFGSHLQWPDDTIARLIHDDAAVEELIWQRLCETPEGPAGAAWDELVANEDRHHENVVFDGHRWWLFDHEEALEPIARVMKRFTLQATRAELAQHQAKANTLASQMVLRRPNDHGLERVPPSLLSLRKRLQWMADSVRGWRTGNDEIDQTFAVAEVVLRSIDLRMPALALHLHKRLARPEGDALWNSSTSPTPSRKRSPRRPA